MPRRKAALLIVKLIHTLVWFLFVVTIFAIPATAAAGWFRTSIALILFVVGEGVVLLLNRGRCPLTSIAARYTDDRRDNFDIFLPVWVARWNKVIFGTLYLMGVVLATFEWMASYAGL